MPAQSPHSSCRMTPASAERIVTPVSSAVPVPQLTRVLVDVEMDPFVSRPVLEQPTVEHSPPRLFVAHSAFLI
ncbi:MAG TPA: hypothetical protein VGL72_33645 [Bryobacteraceae bacterium]